MKTHLLIVSFFTFINSLTAQITSPAIKANFGVDGELQGGFFNNAISTSDDWFKNLRFGTGQAIIDTAGAAAIVANYTSNPASRMTSFSRLMKPAFYSTLQNHLVIDAVFHRDFHGDDSTVFASGSNKNGMSPVLWSCPVAQGIPDKNDILDAFTHIRRAGPNVTDSLWMLGGISIENTNGNRYFDFELYQTDIFYNRTNQTFGGYGPNAGHTAWQFDASGNVLKAGDIIFSAEYSSASLTLIQARIWINKNSLLSTPVNFNWGGQFDGDGASATYGYASILPKTAGAFYTGLQSTGNTWAGPFSLIRTDNSLVTDYIDGQFMEFSVNLTKLGVDPGSYSNNPCGTPFRRVLVKTRSSTSFTSELKDFIAPFRMFDYPPVDAFTNFLYFCKIFPLTPINVINPNPTSVYTWSTSNGHIVGSNTGISIMVDAPGTYYVTQQLSSACPFYSKDSVTIFFDSVCMVMNVNFTNFTTSRVNGITEFNWQASGNNEAASYDIEYSLDGYNFSQLATVAASNDTDIANYSFTSSSNKINAAIIYFRIKVTGKDGRTKYSNMAMLRDKSLSKLQSSIFPNPTHGQLWLSVKGIINEAADVAIWNAQGKLISNTKVNIAAGENILQLPDLSNHTPGVYLVKVKSSAGSITQKVLKLN
ncbi:T9SS type A sorting domain-containing protein [Ferruginibacter sp.]|nr:T9SS type A sorting domain-containing protein [Ferruginibacter sp.]